MKRRSQVSHEQAPVSDKKSLCQPEVAHLQSGCLAAVLAACLLLLTDADGGPQEIRYWCLVATSVLQLSCDIVLSAGNADWVLTVVGGGRRGKPSHDADFVVTHHHRCCLAGCCHDPPA